MPATEQYFRNIKQMHVVFCISMAAFCVATLLILYKDHNDEWRDYQQTFTEIEALKIQAELQQTYAVTAGSEDEFNQKKLELESEEQSLQAELETSSAEFASLTDEIAELDRQNKQQGSDVRFKRADRDVARANYDLGVRDNIPADDLAILKKKFDTLQSEVAQMELDWERLETDLEARQAALAAVTEKRDEVTGSLKKFTAEYARLDDALDAIQPDSGSLKSAKRSFMEWPIIDGFNSHMKVEQDWLPNLHVTLGMTSVARFDRCRTCHKGISQFGAGNVPTYPHGEVESDDPADWVAENRFPHPFSSHPRPDVYLTASSPHPQAEFGCTICHDGQGTATSFLNAQHGPNDPHQEHEWAHDYGHYHNHFWELPMQPKRLQESTCLKCHHDVVELGVNPEFGATAPKVYDGWNLIRKYGCFGCHEINGHDGGDRIGPDLRLEPTEEEAPKYAADPNMIPGKMRKVGPSLKHIAQKTSKEFIAYWTEEPARFRPTTKMPRFFDFPMLEEQFEDHYGVVLSQVELAALAHHLIKQSDEVTLDSPAEGYEPNAERGKTLFAERGCLACHSFKDQEFEGTEADFGPDLTQTSKKLLPGDAGFNWLYTWIRDPQRHHPRSRMPNLYLDAYETADGVVDPAADIAKFLQGDGPQEFPEPEYDAEALKRLTSEYLAGKALTHDQFDDFWASRRYPFKAEQIKGDEIALVSEGDGAVSDEQWNDMLLDYVGRRSVARYGCYGCHDINGYGTARPIGTALQDWGRKDPHRLAPEHIHEFLHHHGQPDGSSTATFVEDSLTKAVTDTFSSEQEKEDGMRTAFFYDSLIHHGRPGFIFQKLRDPRSYDYKKIETKGYTERLVMPKFPVTEEEAEAIATFVLGLVAEPPSSDYVYTPDRQAEDRNQGEILLQKYNCAGCHMLDMPEIEFAPSSTGPLAASTLQPADHPSVVSKLLDWRQPVTSHFGAAHQIDIEDEPSRTLPTVKIKGLPVLLPDPDDDPIDQIYAFNSWEPVALRDWVAAYARAVSANLKNLSEERPVLGQVTDFAETHSTLAAIARQAESNDSSEIGNLVGETIEQLEEAVEKVEEFLGDAPSVVSGAEEEALTIERLAQMSADVAILMSFGRDNDHWDVLLPASRVVVPGPGFRGMSEGRGGKFAQWLVERLPQEREGVNRDYAWEMSPPPLFRQGDKVQTDWLYRFLKEPEQLRHMAVLRMPRFNMSDDEAQILANYFAAADGVPYPYQSLPETEPDYLAGAEASFAAAHPDRAAATDYLTESWNLLNIDLCIKCHSLGGREFKATNAPVIVRGPDLEYASQRLRPDWTLMWLYNPKWITPFTVMPQNFPKDKTQYEPYFDMNPTDQALGVRDALMNYLHLMETRRSQVPPPQVSAN